MTKRSVEIKLCLDKKGSRSFKEPQNPKRWIIDDKAAVIVRRIYRMYLDGIGVEQMVGLQNNAGI